MSGGFGSDLAVSNSNSIGVSAGAGTTITGAAAAYGSYVQLVASTSADTAFVSLTFSITTNSLSNNMYLTVGVGGAGSEVPVLADYYFCFDGFGNITFPLQIAAGTRVAAKAYSDGGADTAKIAINLFDSNFSDGEGFAGVESVAGAAPNITSANASGTAGTYGSWAQIVASTSRDYKGLLTTVAGTNGGIIAAGGLVYQIGVGAGGSEVPIISDQIALSLSGSSRGAFLNQFIPVQVPAGTRLSYRTTVSGGSANNFRMACMGVF